MVTAKIVLIAVVEPQMLVCGGTLYMYRDAH